MYKEDLELNNPQCGYAIKANQAKLNLFTKWPSFYVTFIKDSKLFATDFSPRWVYSGYVDKKSMIWFLLLLVTTILWHCAKLSLVSILYTSA